MSSIRLRSAHLDAVILPQSGAGIARLDWLNPKGQAVPLLRPYTEALPAPAVNRLGCFVLVPWSNRINGGIGCDGRFHPIRPNRPGEYYPIHGHGWEHGWNVERQSDAEAVLALQRIGAPYSFDARIRYVLDGQAMRVSLDVTNVGRTRLPFGLGLHPYLPRTPGVTLSACARVLWQPGRNRLPERACDPAEYWSFAEPRTLPADVIDHVFEGWDGRAEVHWPENGLRLGIESDARYYIVYTPAGADFFCFEPVDHRIDAHNAEGGPERHGLTMLAPGETLTRRFSFTVKP